MSSIVQLIQYQNLVYNCQLKHQQHWPHLVFMGTFNEVLKNYSFLKNLLFNYIDLMINIF